MLDGFKVVTVTPSGRRRYLKILVKYLLKLRNIVDKHIFWINTNIQEDIDYIENLVNEYPNFFECRYLDNHPPEKIINGNISNFYKYCKDSDTVYVRFDDDIVFIEIEKFEDFVRFRIQNPKFFLVYANIINNSICHYIHQRIDAIDVGFNSDFGEFPPLEYICNNRGEYDPNFALKSFECFIKSYNNEQLTNFKFNKWILQNYERCSINCISWLGEEFNNIAKFGKDEESWLSCHKPRELEKTNCIYGNFIVVHFAYNLQREKLEKFNNPNLLDFFNDLALKYTNFQQKDLS